MALTIWGKDAAGGRYAALAALTNILATLVAATFYEVFFTDSSRGEWYCPCRLRVIIVTYIQ